MKTFQERLRWLARLSLAVLPLPALAQNPLLPGVGAEDRRVAVDAAKAPWRSLVKVQTNLGGRCTGVLVARRRVVTAAHCLFNGRTGRNLPASSLHVLFGYSRGDYRAHATVESFTVGAVHDPRRPAGEALAKDWAVLVLAADSPPEAPPLPIAETPPEAGAPVALGGYSQDKAQILTADTGCRVLGTARTEGGPVLVHDCAATRGTSGTALVAEYGGSWAVVGIGVAASAAAERRNFAVPSAVFAAAAREKAGEGQP